MGQHQAREGAVLAVTSGLRGAGWGIAGGAAGGGLAYLSGVILPLFLEALDDPSGGNHGWMLTVSLFGFLWFAAVVVGAAVGAVAGGVIGLSLAALRFTRVPLAWLPWIGAGLAVAALGSAMAWWQTLDSTPVPSEDRVSIGVLTGAAWLVPVAVGGVMAHRQGSWVVRQATGRAGAGP